MVVQRISEKSVTMSAWMFDDGIAKFAAEPLQSQTPDAKVEWKLKTRQRRGESSAKSLIILGGHKSQIVRGQIK